MTTYTFSIYKNDKRTKTGCKLIKTMHDIECDDTKLDKILHELTFTYPTHKHQVEYRPSMKTVKNLMTGLMISIPYDTPRSCDPSSELYWSM